MDRRRILTAGVSALGIPTFLRAIGGTLAGDRAAAATSAVVKSEAARIHRAGPGPRRERPRLARPRALGQTLRKPATLKEGPDASPFS